jgi:ParB/RepB/Spo0J family partition protein
MVQGWPDRKTSDVDLEHQQLDLRYSQLRLRAPEREKKLVASIADVGQLVPIAVVPSRSDPGRRIVIDGFKRIRALRRLRRDLVRAICWDLSEMEALLLYRSLCATRGESVLEQAWLLQEIHGRFDITMEDLARQFDRSPSWVSRRLALVRELPEGVQEEVRLGRIAPHAATKYLVPVARANREDCERVARAIAQHGFSTRDVGELYAGWRDGSVVTRERLLADPELYLRSRRALAESSQEPLGPREGLLKDVEVLSAVARRATQRLRGAGHIELAPLDFETLFSGLELASSHVRRLTQTLEILRGGGDARPELSDSDPRAA